MTKLTDEAVKALLDGATPGPWRADGEPWNRIVWSSAENRVCFMAHSSGLNDERDIATSNLAAAAPDLARALLAARADAEAAVALALEEAVTILQNLAQGPASSADALQYRSNALLDAIALIRALAPEDAIAEVEALRKDRDHADKRVAELQAALSGGVLTKTDSKNLLKLLAVSEAERDRLAAAHDKYQRDVFGLNNEGDPIGGDPPSGLKRRAETAEAGLAAANAREAGLRKALEVIREWTAFPPSGRFWRNGDGTISARPMPYGAAFGSNGERDFMRQVARAALAQPSTEGEA